MNDDDHNIIGVTSKNIKYSRTLRCQHCALTNRLIQGHGQGDDRRGSGSVTNAPGPHHVVCCELGHLYNKEAVIQHLLNKSKNNDKDNEFDKDKDKDAYWS